jgi:hypothetical protein
MKSNHQDKTNKRLFDLIFEYPFKVLNVETKSYSTEFTPVSEMVVGGTSRLYKTGFSVINYIDVYSLKQIPVRRLIFEGFSSVRKNDYILVKMPIYKEKKEYNHFGSIEKRIYFERDILEQEKAIEICIFDKFFKELYRKELSIDYDFFIKK